MTASAPIAEDRNLFAQQRKNRRRSAILVWAFILFFAWIPVLLYGRFPAIGYDLVGGYLRFSTRVSAWIIRMAGPYPPFGLR